MEKENFGDSEFEKIKDEELIPAKEGLVFKENERFLNPEYFSAIILENIPENILRPMVIELEAEDEESYDEKDNISCKSIFSSGKSCFIEKGLEIRDIGYNFIQWKGVGNNHAAKSFITHLTDNTKWVNNPLFPKSHFPIVRTNSGKVQMTLNAGAAYYDDLKKEAEQTAYLEQIGLRIPKPLALFKFSRSFAEKEGIPIPINNDPEDLEGETIRQFEERLINSGVDEDIRISDDGRGILGQEIRAFRNLYRLLDVSETLKISNKKEKEEKILSIINASKNILSKEFKQELNNIDFLKKSSKLLAEQAVILIKNKIIHHGLYRFNQDLTLAVEIADWDSVNFIQELPVDEQKHHMPKLYQQMFLLCGYLKSLSEAIEITENKKIDDVEIVNIFFRTLINNFSENEISEIQSSLNLHPEIFNIKDLCPECAIKKDFEKYQEYASLLLRVFKEFLLNEQKKGI